MFLDRFKRKFFARGRYWEIAEDLSKEISLIRVLRGKFKGVVYAYTTVNVDKMTFGALIVMNPRHRILKHKFHKLMANILYVILWDMFSNPGSGLQIGIQPGQEYVSDDRENGIEEPVEIRAIREKGSSLFEQESIQQQD